MYVYVQKCICRIFGAYMKIFIIMCIKKTVKNIEKEQWKECKDSEN